MITHLPFPSETKETTLADLVASAQSKARARVLDAFYAQRKAHETYAFWVEKASALEISFDKIRVEITSGEGRKNSSWQSEMTKLYYNGKEWKASRCKNAPPRMIGFGWIEIDYPTEKQELKSLKAKVGELGLSVRKDGTFLLIYKAPEKQKEHPFYYSEYDVG